MSGSQAAATPRGESLLWLRMWKLSVGSQSGRDAVNLSDLAFEFSVEIQMAMPTRAAITITNPDPKLVTSLQQQYTVVRLEAGYTPPSTQYGLLFQGEIAYFRYGRKDALDTFIEIVAYSQDRVFTLASVNTTLDSGYKPSDLLRAAIEAMRPYGITLGSVPADLDQGQTANPRGRALVASIPALLRDITQSTGTYWFIDAQNRLNIVRNGQGLPDAQETVPLINTGTGMVDMPTVTLNGAVDFKCLLNPNIRFGGRVKLDQPNVITQYGFGNDNRGTGATGIDTKVHP